jgi:hypothetical protein
MVKMDQMDPSTAKLQQMVTPPVWAQYDFKRGLYGYESPWTNGFFFKWTRVTVELTGVLFYDTRSREATVSI